MSDWFSWREAMQTALYGRDGFYLRERPRDHFRTSVAVTPVFAHAVRRLAGQVDRALRHPDPFDVVDLGSGDGRLLSGLPDVPARWRLTGVDLAPAPPADPAGVGMRWSAVVPPLQGLLIANEWLDNVPLDVVEQGRVVEVARDGSERLGSAAPVDVLEWSRRWWPGPGRVEVGLARDRAWAAAVSQVRRGLAVAVDYGHVRATRRPTLTGYRGGRQVAAVPDGSCDLTAHVAVDSLAVTCRSMGLPPATVLSQRSALMSLGVSGALPDRSLAADPGAYAAALQSASDAGELLDPARLGSFWWIVQPVGIEPVRLGV